MVLEVVIVIFLVFLNGFFVAAEFAIVKVRASQLEVKTATNARLARATKHIMEHLDGYLAATQLGITIASLGLGWLGEDVFSKIVANALHYFGVELSHAVLHTIAGSLAFVFVTFMHVVFGELMPKSVAIRYALPTTISVAYPLQFCYFVFRPFIYLFNGFANFMLGIMGIGASHGHGEAHSEEELRFILQESKHQQEDLSDVKKYEIIDKVFEFDDKQVMEIMTPRGDMVGIEIKGDPDDILDTILNNKFSRYPVFQGDVDNIVGILHVQSLLEYLRNTSTINLKEKGLLTQPIYIPSSMRVGDLLLDLQKKKKHLAIVVDEYGGVQGLITLEDIIEELLGEIYDEYDDTDIVHPLGDNSFLVNATAKIMEVNQYLPIPLPVPDGMRFGTVSGLVRYTVNRVPNPGEVISLEHYDISVVRRYKHNKIKLVELKLKG
ncbi:MAG: HlyC/CorC family transporter [Bacteroidetes bacterium]|nr:MAG: HlyC/CorC family transporter [Bacteroidota bacterium]